jgi:hypothetical protein
MKGEERHQDNREGGKGKFALKKEINFEKDQI